jgi:hypothetical protein
MMAGVPNRRPQLRLAESGQYRGRSLALGDRRRAVVAPAASPEEAAAVVAALERFMRETAPTPAPLPPPVSGWLRAARLEAVEREPRHAPWS